MQTRLASYSEENLLRKTGKKKISGKLLRESFIKGIAYDLEIVDVMNPDCGRYTSPVELQKAGERNVIIRFNHDRNLVSLPLNRVR